MLGAKPLTDFQTKVYEYLWNTTKFNDRSTLKCVLVPLSLSAIFLVIRLIYFPDALSLPYLGLLTVVLISACFGGNRSAFFASIFTFITGLVLLYQGRSEDTISYQPAIWQLCFYLVQTLFLSWLLSRFELKQKLSIEEFSDIEQKNEEILLREKHLIDFVNMATHELKTPVTVLKAYIQLVEARLEKDGQQDYLKFLNKMDVQLDKLLNLISDLLDSTRISSGSLSCIFNEFNINDCLRECIESFKTSNPDVKIGCELISPDPIIVGDKDRIDQVVTNFISNAIKYSPSEKNVCVRNKVVDNHLLISVEDKGLGIPAEKQKDVFSRFYRVKTKSTEKLPGLGLGLFISSEIVKKHDGKIGLESELGKGSTFWFSLPI